MSASQDVTNLQLKIHQLAWTIRNLSQRTGKDWVSWRQVAKEQEGSEELEVELSCLAFLPEAVGLFSVTNDGRFVKLTEKGLQLAAKPPQRQDSQVQMIALAVKKYASSLKPQTLNVERLITIARTGKKYVQAVYVNLEDNVIPPETPVRFISRGGKVLPSNGRIVGQEPDGNILYVAFEHEVLGIHLPAILHVDRAFLLHKLATSIENLDELPLLAQPLLKTVGTGFPIGRDQSEEVADGLAQLRSPWTRFLWGPPGAGKTYALGRLVMRLIRAEPKCQVLIVAPSNLAVDVALEQFIKQIQRSELSYLIGQRKIFRYGYPRKSEILGFPELLGPANLDEHTQKIKLISSRISRAERAEASDADLAVLRAELLAEQESLKTLVKEHIKESQVVATTATLAYLPSSPIAQTIWNTVLVDEVTMIPPAMCIFLSSLAQKRLLLAGDPRQLGPVYEESNRSSQDSFNWMGRDVFDLGGISNGHGESRRILTQDIRLARITSQRRCGDEIWDKVKHLYPEVRSLVDDNPIRHLRALPPLSGRGVVLLDVGAVPGNAICRQVNSSWQNSFTADLAIELVSTITSEDYSNATSIAIIAPYRSHVKLLKKQLREEYRSKSPLSYLVEVGTIHQFQGSEADIVIFDMVDGEGRNKLGKLLSGDTGIRLVNVAITRARGKLVLLANRGWCQSHMERTENPILWDLIVGRKSNEQLRVLPPPSIEQSEPRHLTESPIEQALLEAMKLEAELQDVETQWVIRDLTGNPISRADFAFPTIKYAVYCDGAQWHLKYDRWQRDWRQRNKLTELGWSFSVFTGRQINTSVEECVKQIIETRKSIFKNRRQ